MHIFLFYLFIYFVLEEDKAKLLSIVKAFDSLLAAYEGFCNLKQVQSFFVLFYGWEEKKKNERNVSESMLVLAYSN